MAFLDFACMLKKNWKMNQKTAQQIKSTSNIKMHSKQKRVWRFYVEKKSNKKFGAYPHTHRDQNSLMMFVMTSNEIKED